MESDAAWLLSEVATVLAEHALQPLEDASAHDQGEAHWGAYEEFLRYSPGGSGDDVCSPVQSTRRVGAQHVEPKKEGTERPQDFDHAMPSAIYPDIDMSTALMASGSQKHPGSSPGRARLDFDLPLDHSFMVGESLDLVPSFYTYAVKACLLPIRKVQHELVALYFQYIQPMFPVVDEDYFTELHRKYYGHEHFMDPADFVVYQAITAAGFGHLSASQLQRTPYRNVHEGQEAQFDQVKVRYRSETATDPIVLTQICLIISLWSPGPAGAQNNSYWLNLAFKHANAAELWNSRPPNHDRPCRRRLLWWCCLVRDRTLALGMRRPYRLHKAPFEEELVSTSDFCSGPSVLQSTETGSKRISILAFIWLCKLSEIMAAIAVFQQRAKFSREWNGESVENSKSELDEVTAFERDIIQWKQAFETDVNELTGCQDDHDVPISISILRIVCNSLVAVLYQPYLHLSCLSNPSSSQKDIDPLQRMKEGSQAVESSVIDLISSKKSDALPNWLVTWVTLPVAVYYVNQHVKPTPSPDRVLVPFLNRFMRRTTGAQFLFLALTKAMKEFLQRDQGTGRATGLGRKLAPATYHVDHAVSAWNAGNSVVEARILAHVTKVLDSTLEHGC